MIAYSAAVLVAPGEGGNPAMALIIQLVAIVAIFWFLLIRPQRQAQKRHEAMIAALKRGDEVLTEGGIIGEVIHIKEDRVTMKTADSTRIVVARAKIARVFQAPGVEMEDKS